MVKLRLVRILGFSAIACICYSMQFSSYAASAMAPRYDEDSGNQNPASLVRGPYLQIGTATGLVLRWRTDNATTSRVRYGVSANNLSSFVDSSATTTEHEVGLSDLLSDTKYYYSIGSTSDTLSVGSDYFFVTAPPPGTTSKSRIWVIGDAGTANSNQRAVRDAFYAFTDTIHTNLWVMLGDNAYGNGKDNEYQAAVFDMYPAMLRKSVLWPAFGNHDGHSASSSTQTGPFYDIFTLPKNAEAGGVATGTEAYYSFEYANIHFICLNSHDVSRATTGPMLTWLREDLAGNDLDWTIAFWHHPPYTKGSHNSDNEGQLIEMRQNALPILENGGVDLVLTGHSHSYERSYLLDGHYGSSNTLTNDMIVDGGDGREDGDGSYNKATLGPASHEGAVYIVAGSSGKTSSGSLNHPAMSVSLKVLGSVVLDVDSNRVDVTFLDDSGTRRDYFTLTKGETGTPVFVEVPTVVPDRFELAQNYPNPFNAETTISYAMPTSGFVSLKIMNILGHEIASLVNEFQRAGNHSVRLDATNLATGVYFYKLQIGTGIVETKKMLLMK